MSAWTASWGETCSNRLPRSRQVSHDSKNADPHQRLDSQNALPPLESHSIAQNISSCATSATAKQRTRTMDSTQSGTPPPEQRTLHSDIETAILIEDVTRTRSSDGRVILLPNHENGHFPDIQIVGKRILFYWLLLATLIEVLAALIFFLAIPESLTTCVDCADDVTDHGILLIFKAAGKVIATITSFLAFPISLTIPFWTWECPDFIANWANFVVGATLTILISATLIYCAINIWDCYNRQKYEEAESFALPAFLVVALIPLTPVLVSIVAHVPS